MGSEPYADKHVPNKTISESSGDNDGQRSQIEDRLWIGNLDPKLSEFNLLKIVQRFGTVKHFDFLFHRSGPYKGLPRGYAFVTFSAKNDALKCKTELEGKKILNRHVAVRWAHQATQEFIDEETKLKNKLPVLAMTSETEQPKSKNKMISAIEAKLEAMNKEKNSNFQLSTSSGHRSNTRNSKCSPSTSFNLHHNSRTKPYDRK